MNDENVNDLFDNLDEALSNVGGFVDGGVDVYAQDDDCVGGGCKI